MNEKMEHMILLGIKHPAVLKAVMAIPRSQFLDASEKMYAEIDEALPIECGQTISQPSLVARMTELMLGKRDKVAKALEIGTGSGYQAAILSQVADAVYTIERHKTLFTLARSRFQSLKLDNIHSLHGDGYLGWPEYAPYDGIVVTAATPHIPSELLKQLNPFGGQLVIPVGEQGLWQELQLVKRREDEYEVESHSTVVF